MQVKPLSLEGMIAHMDKRIQEYHVPLLRAELGNIRATTKWTKQ